ncbi:hypothetical protein C8R46DRAFT_1050368 [Mycena filopes]|nr:hypothetical protein C8R46DRAFT_1050368 [Mycena filopes]
MSPFNLPDLTTSTRHLLPTLGTDGYNPRPAGHAEAQTPCFCSQMSKKEPQALRLDAIDQANRYRFYLIYGDSPNGIERRWSRLKFNCAASVWSAYHADCYDLIQRSWYFGTPMEAHRGRIYALRVLGYALEAQGDTTRTSTAYFQRVLDRVHHASGFREL